MNALKRNSLLVLFLFALAVLNAAASKASPAPIDPASVQILAKWPNGDLYVSSAGGFSRFAGTYKTLGFVVTPMSGDSSISPQEQWLDLQKQTAALGGNAVMITGTQEESSGFVRGHGAPAVEWSEQYLEGTAVLIQGTTSTADAASPFVYDIPFQSSRRAKPIALESGDGLEITSVRGDRPHLELGGTYLVQGQYKLTSANGATLRLTPITAPGTGMFLSPTQFLRVAPGTGTFSLVAKMSSTGRFHVALTPAASGKPTANILFREKLATTEPQD